MGISDIPSCTQINSTYCTLMDELLAKGAYVDGVRNISVFFFGTFYQVS